MSGSPVLVMWTSTWTRSGWLEAAGNVGRTVVREAFSDQAMMAAVLEAGLAGGQAVEDMLVAEELAEGVKGLLRSRVVVDGAAWRGNIDLDLPGNVVMRNMRTGWVVQVPLTSDELAISVALNAIVSSSRVLCPE